MKTLLICLLFASPVFAYDRDQDWHDVNEQRQFDQYQLQEQRRFEYEQDRYDQYDYQQRRQESAETWADNWDNAHD